MNLILIASKIAAAVIMACSVFILSCLGHLVWLMIDDYRGYGDSAMKREAVKLGYARWSVEVDEGGHATTHFVWKATP